jgi:hypothetical protein
LLNYCKGILNYLVFLHMPYYRILIWTKRRKQPFRGIRIIDNPNINAVFNMIDSKASDTFKKDLIEVEVQMLSKLCNAVKEFQKKVY